MKRMKKNSLTVLFSLFLFMSINGQVTKNNWLVGGNINFSSSKYRGDATVNQNRSTILIGPKIGYFILDKFATGLLLNYQNDKTKSPGTSSPSQNVSSFGIGPFLRYYFLKPGQIANIFFETSYQYGTSKSNTGNGNISKYNTNNFSFSGGPVVYFNTTVGIEFTIGYLSSKYINYNDHSNHILIGLGLQIHLEKE